MQEARVHTGATVGAADERPGPATEDYLMANEHPATAGRFTGLSATYDPVTFRQLDAVGVGPGWRCLEVGAGSGSVARWLSDRVGADGRVLAVDLDTRWLAGAERPNLEIRPLDVRSDALPEAAFDLIHARLVLIHLPDRAEVLARLVRSLRPGGWLVTSEFDTLIQPCPDPTDETQALVNRVLDGFQDLLRARGADPLYGRRLLGAFRSAGLAEVHVDAHLEVATGGSTATAVLRANMEQTREELVRRGRLSPAEVDRFLTALDEPEFTCLMPALFTARGRRPPAQESYAGRNRS
jgi:SAM-dependent methyltransferase